MSPDKEKKEDKGGKEEAASIDSPLRLSDPSTFRPPDSPTNIDSPIQKTNLTSLQAVVEIEQRKVIKSSQKLDVGLGLNDTDQAMDEAEQREADQSTQELDEGLELEDTNQVKEDHVDDKRAGERDEDGQEEEKRTTKASKLMSWLRKMWTAPRGTQSRAGHDGIPAQSRSTGLKYEPKDRNTVSSVYQSLNLQKSGH